MKRNLIKARNFILIIVTVVCVPQLFAQAPTAVIKEMTGTVELQRAGATNWTGARAGDRIDADTVVSTGFKSTAILTIGNSTLTVKPITRLSLKELVSQNETEVTTINLNTGRVRAEVRPPAGGKTSFSVQTTTATASVRGTTFEMDTVSLKVIEGVVSFAPAGSNRAVTVSAGQATQVDTETGVALTPLAAAEVERLLPDLAGQSSRFSFDRISIPGDYTPGDDPATQGDGSLGINIELKSN